MGKPHPVELRARVVGFVDEGHSHRKAARHFRVSPKFVNDMIKLRRETGALAAKRQGNLGHAGKLRGLEAWVRGRLGDRGDLTLDELRLELEQVHDVTVHRSSVGGWLHRLGLSHKKTLLATEQHQPDVALARRVWITRRQPFMGMQRHFHVTPPTVHQMILTLERTGLIQRQAGKPRSIELLVVPEDLPILR